MLTFKQYLKLLEHLTDQERDQLHSKNFDTTKGEQLFKGIMPEGQTHIEIPISSPLELRIRNHFQNNPIIDQKTGNVSGHWQWDGKSDYAQHPIHSNRTQRVSSIISDDDDLLSDYTNAKSLSGDKSRIGNVDTGELSNDKYKIIITRHPYGIFGKSSKLKPWDSCARPETEKDASAHLINDINEGGAVAYLVHKDEPNPNDPEKAIGRVSLNPFESENGHIILRAAPRLYGKDDEQNRFLHTVRDWVARKFPMDDKSKSYVLNPNVYGGDTPQKILPNINMYIKNFNEKIKNGILSSSDVQHSVDMGYSKIVLSKNFIKKLSEQNDPKMNEALSNVHIYGHDIGKESINNITRHPDSQNAHELLAIHHIRNGNIGNEAVDNLLKNINSDLLRTSLIDHRKTINEFNDKVKNGTIEPEDLIKIVNKQYMNSISMKNIMPKLANDPRFHDVLANSVIEGFRIGNGAIRKIANNPEALNAHASLIHAYITGKRIPNDALVSIANNPNSTMAHHAAIDAYSRNSELPLSFLMALSNNPNSTAVNRLARIYGDGKDIPKDVLMALSKNKNARDELIKSYLKRKEMPKEVIHSIANSSDASNEHELIAQLHSYGNEFDNETISGIANNPDSTKAHDIFIESHLNGREIPKEALISIAKNPKNFRSHELLAKSYFDGKYVPKEVLISIAKNPESYEAHSYMAEAHVNGKHIPEEAIDAIWNNPRSRDAHNIFYRN